MFIEPTIIWVPSGFSGYYKWLDTKIVLKKKYCQNHRFDALGLLKGSGWLHVLLCFCSNNIFHTGLVNLVWPAHIIEHFRKKHQRNWYNIFWWPPGISRCPAGPVRSWVIETERVSSRVMSRLFSVLNTVNRVSSSVGMYQIHFFTCYRILPDI